MRTSFIKFLLIVLTLSNICFTANAQRPKERRIYYLDCSGSMHKNKVNDTILWNAVRKNLCTAIERIGNDSTEIHIILFAYDKEHHNVGTLTSFVDFSNPIGKENLKNKIMSLPKTTETYTFLSDPLLDFYDRCVNDDMVTIMFFMTDGENEERKYDKDKRDKFLPLLEQWKSKYGNRDVYGFYVMLDKKAKNDEIERVIGDRRNQDEAHLWKVESADVNINLIRLECKEGATFNLNVKEKSHIAIPFSYYVNGVNIGTEFVVPNRNYSIANSDIQNDSLYLIINKNRETWKLPPADIVNLKLNIVNPPNEYTFLSPTKINIRCEYPMSPALKEIFVDGLHEGEFNIGISTYYPPFISKAFDLGIWGADTTGVVRTFRFVFDKDAKEVAKRSVDSCYVKFQFVDEFGDAIPDSELQITGDIQAHSFVVSPLDTVKVFSFRYMPGVEEGTHKVFLAVVNSANIRQVNNHNLADEKLVASYSLDFVEKINPFWWLLLGILLLLLTIVAAIIAIFIAHRLLSPKFPKYAQISFDSGLDNNIGIDLCMYKNKLLSGAGNGTQASVFFTHLLSAYHIKKIIITSQTVNANNPEKFRFLSRKWISQQWNGDTIYINGVFNNYPIKHITITPRGRFQSYADVTIEFTREITENNRSVAIKEEKLCFYKLLERDNPHPVSIVVFGNVLILGEIRPIVN